MDEDDATDRIAEDEGDIATEVAGDPDDFLGLMGHFYRGELGRSTNWRSRMDRTTNWAVVVVATITTWAFSSPDNPHYVLLLGAVIVGIFGVTEARRYRMFDVWRSRVRVLEENVFATAIDPEDVVREDWRELLAADLREPHLKISLAESLHRRLKRVYTPLISVLVFTWLARVTVFPAAGTSIAEAAAIGPASGHAVLAVVAVAYAGVLTLTLIPVRRRAKGEVREQESYGGEWR